MKVGNSMDLYYAVTNYHLLCCITHKMKYNQNNATLLISEYLTEVNPKLTSKIEKIKVFDDIVVIDKPEFFESDEYCSKSKLELRITEICKKIDKKYAKILKKASHIYSCVDFDELGIYMIKNNIKYSYFEDACGILSQEELVLKVLHIRKKFIQEMKCLGNNDNVINRYGSLKDQKEGYYNPKDVDYCLKDILKSLTKDEMRKILSIYNLEKLKIPENANLLLTMHYGEQFSNEEQETIYKTIIDYFTKENETLIIKPHPADSIRSYKNIFPKSIELPKSMPSELFPYCITTKFKNGITCWSTSVFGLKDIIHNIVNFDKRIDETYVDFDKYYAIVLYLKERKTKEKVTLVCEEFNEIQLERLFTKYFSNYKKYYVISDKENPDTDNIHLVNEKTSKDDKKVIELMGSFQTDHYIHIAKEYQSGEKKNEYVGLYNMDDIHLDSKKELKYSGYQITITNKTATEIIPLLCEEKRIEKNKYEKELLEKEKKIEKMQNKIDSYCYDMNALYNSTSWKMTKPFRKIVDFIRHFQKK